MLKCKKHTQETIFFTFLHFGGRQGVGTTLSFGTFLLFWRVGLEGARPRTTTHDHARPRTTTHDHERPRTTTHDHDSARPRTTTHDRARPRTTAHDHARPRTTTNDHARPRQRTTTHDHTPVVDKTAAIFVWGSSTCGAAL